MSQGRKVLKNTTFSIKIPLEKDQEKTVENKKTTKKQTTQKTKQIQKKPQKKPMKNNQFRISISSIRTPF